MADSTNRFQISMKDKGYHRESPISGAVVVKSEGNIVLAAAEARFIGENVKLEFLKFSRKYPEAAEAALATAAVHSLLNHAGLIFLPPGRAYADEQITGRSIGFVLQNINMLLRLSVADYNNMMPSDCLLIDPSKPIQAASLVLKYIEEGRVDIPTLTSASALRALWQFASEGVPPIDWAPGQFRPL